ncbi:hypothetical protein MGYG_04663 [Nannizzia gypsea CBS 118893]|uniref:Uncharacterized protein n=1 Tax=Arthroderma gypseum (strain ATCC MYA-4604 / CBS 118893) TaxID=535722 RepID=E4UW53_ARTGP|nr:hypothetical protein MGYG_04663 [Nannizzia gypsea CBS 118893]EFR01661.1 hypothetical protein MGYG_04663 [Nannizzia gypsea CBS 118893]
MVTATNLFPRSSSQSDFHPDLDQVGSEQEGEQERARKSQNGVRPNIIFWEEGISKTVKANICFFTSTRTRLFTLFLVRMKIESLADDGRAASWLLVQSYSSSLFGLE